MKKIKSFISVVLIALMILNTITVFAANNPIFEVETVNAKPGESVEVSVSIKNNPGIASIGLRVEYDSLLTLTGIEYNSTVDGTFTSSPTMNSPVELNWVDTKDSIEDWTFATLTFLVSNDVNTNTKADVIITYDPNDVYDYETETNVYFDVKNGAVNIEVPNAGCSHSNTTVVPAKESTCKEQGNNAYIKCDDCGEITSGSDAKLPLADHNYTQTVDDKYLISVATCTQKAKYYESCSVCGEKGSETFENGEVNTENHKLVEVKSKKETHKENGNIAYFDCIYCDKYFIDSDAKTEIALADTIIAKGEHDYGTDYQNDSKNHWKECNCGDVIQKETHTFGDWVVTKEATKTQSGSKERICSVCKYKVTQRIPATYRPTSNNNSSITKPNTETGGDNSIAVLWIALSAVSVAGFTITVIFKRKRVK